VSSIEQPSSESKAKKSDRYEINRVHFELGAAVLIVLGGYFLLRQLNLVPDIGVTDNMSYGLVFTLGLVAAVSTCLAVTGGLLLGVAAKYNEKHPNLSGHQKFKPHIYFNIGRIISYAVLGGIVGLVGSTLSLSTKAAGYFTIAVSIVMIALGFQLLNIFPFFKNVQLRMPKFIAHKIHETADKKEAPFMLGALTFFLPCGFTQALQLYVLAKGDPITGALTMFFFSLGTMPALVSLGALSSFSKGTFQRYFTKTAAVVIVVFGVLSMQSGLALTGFGAIMGDASDSVPVVDSNQVVAMQVAGLDYYPNAFKIKRGVLVEWRVDGRQASGCAQILAVPSLGITERLSRTDITVIRFTPQKTGKIKFTCGMGMAGPGVFEVV
jgi:sulfite exporter TauE/SafE